MIIFIRVPEWGKVKTRLAKDVGNDRALQIYSALLKHTREISLHLSAQCYVYYASYPIEDNWSESIFIKRSQKGDNLGQRMKNAFAEVLNEHEQVMIIGSDCPQLSSEMIENAFKSLTTKDAVIGPSYDGGYYLLGMKKLHSELFTDMEWSTDSVLDQTLMRMKNLDLDYEVLQTLSDVDHKADWDQYGWELSE